ncbi:MAG: hypothetical protein GX458_20580 [Phyllobacteriaceae bacterium]|nr:hypothetical protein [Phyllobacteriaceae bacterium]
MFAALSTLDTPLGPKLVRPFYVVGSALAVAIAGIGLIVGAALATSSVLLALFVAGFFLLAGATVFLGVRLTAEAVTIVFARTAPRPVGSTMSRTA